MSRIDVKRTLRITAVEVTPDNYGIQVVTLRVFVLIKLRERKPEAGPRAFVSTVYYPPRYLGLKVISSRTFPSASSTHASRPILR